MPSRSLHLASSQPAMAGIQTSRPNAFAPTGGRGRLAPLRPVTRRVPGQVGREEFLAFWAGLMRRRCGSAREVAYTFRRTEQTGRNWLDGAACPTGWDVAKAYSLWPDDFDATLQTLRGR